MTFLELLAAMEATGQAGTLPSGGPQLCLSHDGVLREFYDAPRSEVGRALRDGFSLVEGSFHPGVLGLRPAHVRSHWWRLRPRPAGL